jgi:hypothetical protein
MRYVSVIQASNDSRPKVLSYGRSAFPEDAVARIFKLSRSVTTSGKARTRGWRLVLEWGSAPFIEPLIGYTGSTETLKQVQPEFPTLRSAIRYAKRQGLNYVVQRLASRLSKGWRLRSAA